MKWDTQSLIRADWAHCWHPFTRQGDWCEVGHQPLVLVKGKGAWLWDSEGRKYFDGNSSIWTNIHGHAHEKINEAMARQMGEVSHVSFLGFTHPWAIELAGRLCRFFPEGTLERVFFSDDGSTAVECALKLALQYRLQKGELERTGFVAFSNGYHGDTLGAASLGGVGRFFDRFKGRGYEVEHVKTLDELKSMGGKRLAGVVIEPMIQGVNEMRPWPAGMLADLRAWCDQEGVHLILDEVMTGFGRTGKMFACEHEAVVPDFLCVAKGLSAGYLPLAATLTTHEVYEAFLGDASRAFYYGHSYTANPLGCAAALASLDVFEDEQVLSRLQGKIDKLRGGLERLKQEFSGVYEVRQCGFVAGIELRRSDGMRHPMEERVGERVCMVAREFGLLTRPILDTIVVMPPLCTTEEELDHVFSALRLTFLKTGIDRA